jgi:hypothetical protein
VTQVTQVPKALQVQTALPAQMVQLVPKARKALQVQTALPAQMVQLVPKARKAQLVQTAHPAQMVQLVPKVPKVPKASKAQQVLKVTREQMGQTVRRVRMVLTDRMAKACRSEVLQDRFSLRSMARTTTLNGWTRQVAVAALFGGLAQVSRRMLLARTVTITWTPTQATFTSAPRVPIP